MKMSTVPETESPAHQRPQLPAEGAVPLRVDEALEAGDILTESDIPGKSHGCCLAYYHLRLY